MATLAGLQYSRGDAVVVMDVDLQDPPELLHEMVAKWREGYDVVLPQRRARTGGPWIKKTVAATGYKVINKIADVRIPPNTGDFRLMARRVVAETGAGDMARIAARVMTLGTVEEIERVLVEHFGRDSGSGAPKSSRGEGGRQEVGTQ